MGKLILCSGARTTRPYVFTPAGVRIYSIEELCYCLYHHVHLIEEDILCDALFDFIDMELKLPERAEKLRLLKKQNADVKTMVTVILCSADYYTENEIKHLLKILDEVIGMPMVKRSCIKAANYLREHQYTKAASQYERIINSKEATELTPEEYGDLYHNLAVAKLHITGLKEASQLFLQAYERNHSEESLKQYLYTLYLIDNKEEYKKKVEEYQIGEQLDYSIREYLDEVERNAVDSDSLHKIDELEDLKLQGKKEEYDKKIKEIIDMWKKKVRQN